MFMAALWKRRTPQSTDRRFLPFPQTAQGAALSSPASPERGAFFCAEGDEKAPIRASHAGLTASGIFVSVVRCGKRLVIFAGLGAARSTFRIKVIHDHS
jgi:hypothetical protein